QGRKIVLDTSIATIIFQFNQYPVTDKALLRISIEPKDSIQFATIISEERIVERRDIIHLFEFLIEHAEQVVKAPSTNSERYVDDTALYWVQGLGGEAGDNRRGVRFAMSFFVRVEAGEKGTSAYVGCMTEVNALDIMKAYNQIK
ncbi:MAG: hypothetical protein AAFQ07_11465, partial [Chloroflexota bacterium]